MKRILAIETSCDETAIALVEGSGDAGKPRFKVLESLIASQIKIHREFGGVVPNIAKREHLKNLPLLYRRLLRNLGATSEKKTAAAWKKIDAVAMTVGPGLEPALWTGINFAKEIAALHKKPIIGANHMEGHLYSFLLPSKTKTGARSPSLNNAKNFPAIALIVSGGHTMLLLMKDLTHWKLLGETRDDAVGEAYDKMARLLGLPYPGGPEIEKAARGGNPAAVTFPRPMMHDKNYAFSFSGLKTSVLYYLRDNPLAKTGLTTGDIAASFQAAAVEVLVHKTFKAAKEFGARSVILAGGVAANKALRGALAARAKKTGTILFVPEFQFNTDNAAMIAAGAYMGLLRKKKYKLEAQGNLSI